MLSANKAQGMSLKVIIVAIIALILLAVLIMLFTGNYKSTTHQTSKTCECAETIEICGLSHDAWKALFDASINTRGCITNGMDSYRTKNGTLLLNCANICKK